MRCIVSLSQIVPRWRAIRIWKHQTGTSFSAALVLARETDPGSLSGSEQRMKSFAVSLTSTDKWPIVEGELWLENVRFSIVMITYATIFCVMSSIPVITQQSTDCTLTTNIPLQHLL